MISRTVIPEDPATARRLFFVLRAFEAEVADVEIEYNPGHNVWTVSTAHATVGVWVNGFGSIRGGRDYFMFDSNTLEPGAPDELARSQLEQAFWIWCRKLNGLGDSIGPLT